MTFTVPFTAVSDLVPSPGSLMFEELMDGARQALASLPNARNLTELQKTARRDDLVHGMQMLTVNACWHLRPLSLYARSRREPGYDRFQANYDYCRFVRLASQESRVVPLITAASAVTRQRPRQFNLLHVPSLRAAAFLGITATDDVVETHEYVLCQQAYRKEGACNKLNCRSRWREMAEAAVINGTTRDS